MTDLSLALMEYLGRESVPECIDQLHSQYRLLQTLVTGYSRHTGSSIGKGALAHEAIWNRI